MGTTNARPRLWSEVDLSAVVHNLQQVRQHVGPDVRILAVVKSGGYGHGAADVARAALANGACFLGVNDGDEALDLREAGIDGPILLMAPVASAEIESLVRAGIQFTLSPPEIVPALEETARQLGVCVKTHLMVDTGMARFGVPAERAADLAAYVAASPYLELIGVATHFAAADAEDPSFTVGQMEEYTRVLAELSRRGLPVPLRHVANSSATLRYRQTHLDMIRPGLILYGACPSARLREEFDLKPALAVRAQVLYVREVPAQTPIGYGHWHVTSRPSRIATVSVGYADGYPVGLSNQAEMLLHGRRIPVVGRICMSYTSLDVTEIPDVAVGDVATVLGADGEERIRAEELAGLLNIVPYSLLCSLGGRRHRVVRPCQAAPAAPRLQSAAIQ